MYNIEESNLYHGKFHHFREWDREEYVDAFNDIMQTMNQYYESEYQEDNRMFEDAENSVWTALDERHFKYKPNSSKDFEIHFFITEEG